MTEIIRSSNQITTYQEPPTSRGFSVDAIVGAWLNEKLQHSGSRKTLETYKSTIQAFRRMLQEQDLDLIFASTEQLDFVSTIADAAQLFASQRGSNSRHKGAVAASTKAHRITVLSSFYAYAIKRRHLQTINPMMVLDRPHVEDYAGAVALPLEEIQARLATIDQETQEGAQAYAILFVMLATGRRVSEVANLRKRDLQISGKNIILNFSHTKGGKAIRDKLPEDASTILAGWLQMFYRKDISQIPGDAPVWIQLYHESRRGEPLGYGGIAGICERYLKTSKVHTTRHSFTGLMLQSGAGVSDVQKRLQHSNLAATQRYVEKLVSDENKYAPTITQLLRGGKK